MISVQTSRIKRPAQFNLKATAICIMHQMIDSYNADGLSSDYVLI